MSGASPLPHNSDLRILPMHLQLDSPQVIYDSINTWEDTVRHHGKDTRLMANRATALIEKLVYFQAQQEDHRTELDKMVEAIHCPHCKIFFRNPRTLPCGHSFCASCLEDIWRPLLEDRIKNTKIRGNPANTYLDQSVDTEYKFQKRLADMLAHNIEQANLLTTHMSPCCNQPITTPPPADLVLESMCSSILEAAGIVDECVEPVGEEERSFFYMMFRHG
ncbi:hypothetical protein BDN72DRAFT_906996 [Pluteus cervinus]|uniref:Uncharacterized protein n=1 Tax=Pluteus cervinus TaxID=181527 RepID=A0ACD2ZXX8_9AGAR|nr:hypothetical protein BDN72DRAFT_906996 [Pluteus cervinus]